MLTHRIIFCSDKDKTIILIMESSTVTEVTAFIKSAIQGTPFTVTGEVCNFSSKNGHRYFSLKDSFATLSCVFWKSTKLNRDPKNGEKITVQGKIDLYPPQGKYQLCCYSCEIHGKGNLQKEYEKLYKKLKSEGYFDQDIKQPLPSSISTVGIVTSMEGAVIKDIISVFQRRNPTLKVILAGAAVQGKNCIESVCSALNTLDEYIARGNELDVIIIARGGGSMEDLWGFNSETIVDKISQIACPVISAIGHETDFTLCDEVADIRAATPTAAAELITPIICNQEIISKLMEHAKSLALHWILDARRTITGARETVEHRNPAHKYNIANGKIISLKNALNSSIKSYLSSLKTHLSDLKIELRDLDPTPDPLPGRPTICDPKNKYIESSSKLLSLAKTNKRIKLSFPDGDVWINLSPDIISQEEI
jgi:exodeoxyribonuclease VII large subunit